MELKWDESKKPRIYLALMHDNYDKVLLIATYVTNYDVQTDANYVFVFTTTTGTTRVEWPLTSVQRVCVATGGEMEDEGKIFIIQTRP